MEADGNSKPGADEKGQDEQGRAGPGVTTTPAMIPSDPGNDLLARRSPRIRGTECECDPADHEDYARDDDQSVHGPVSGQDREPKPDRDETREERYPPQVPRPARQLPAAASAGPRRGWCSGSSDHPLQRGGNRDWPAVHIHPQNFMPVMQVSMS